MTLVILAAGMGSRFGGLKQLEAIDNDGCFIIDYSVYDAIKAGFTKIVFVIKEENYELFKETIGNRVSNLVKVEYVFQNNDNLIKYIGKKITRQKPFGTAHALYCAKDYIDGSFGIISADDFYGRGSFEKLYEALKCDEHCAIGYKIKNTMSENGSVKRGLCFTNDGYLIENNDYVVEKENGIIKARSIVDNSVIEIDEEQSVSMLMYGLDCSVLKYIENSFSEFFLDNEDDLETCEFLLPNVLTEMIKDKKINIKLIPTSERWMGVTYKEDLKGVKEYIKKLKEEGIYPKKLYKKEH